VATASSSRSAAGTSKKLASNNVAHEAVLSFSYDSPKQAARVVDSISPELGQLDDDRSSVRTSHEGSLLELTVEARDLVALRAAVNTWCSLVSVAEAAGQAE
jgi:KEOPS complex subunit Pcc1